MMTDLTPLPAAPAVELSIVMPCLNEAETLETCIRKARRYLDESGVSGEIVIGDNGSTDGSQEIARRCGARVVPVVARGYGAAIYTATAHAHGRYIIMGDSDDSYDFLILGPFVDKLREGYDLVMGNRFRGGIKNGAMPWKNRYIGNPVLTAIGRLFFRCEARDFHCGLRGFSKRAFERLDLQTTGMEFASEMVIKATLLGLRVTEVPTTLSPDGRSRPPHLKPWRDGWRHLRFMLLYSPRWLFLYPGLTLFTLGAVFGSRLAVGPMKLGHAVLDIHSLLFAGAAVLIGFQAVLFAVVSKTFAIHDGLMPADPRMDRMYRYVKLESGLAVGVVLLLAGFGAALWAVLGWKAHGLGPLDPRQTMRTAIPATVAMVMGSEIIFFSFFLSLLGLHVRTRPDTTAEQTLP